jgi:hypothetical protein
MNYLLTIVLLSILTNFVTPFEGQFNDYDSNNQQWPQYKRTSNYRNKERQMPIVNVQRRVDGNTVYGSINDVVNQEGSGNLHPPQLPVPGAIAGPSNALLESIGSLEAENKMEEQELIEQEPGFLDSILGAGVQSRIVTSLNDWIVDKARTNPGCVERFVCETYRTGETLNGIPYLAMSMTNAAVSFMVADMFDRSIDAKAITKAARHGRTIGSCHTMQCDFVDGQLRDLGDYLETIEEFFTSIFNSVSNSIDFGKK